ncbi:uncharacterized protein [Phaseolus vulgaris]|uniref:uncharacterized protein n=1 Tax=Phaseolus vulgaris TaxID=3885 RepID=UPI0035CA1EDB
MKIFTHSTEKGIWESIENGHFVPEVKKDDVLVDKPSSKWIEAECKKAKFDCIAKNIITSALSCDEFFRVSQCSSAKEMWDILEVTHEGTNDVKRARKHALIQEYEIFRMQKGKSICEVQKRFSHIVNHLMSLGMKFDEKELNIKVLKCLDRTWQPKVTTILESKDLTSMTVAYLFGKLREHEIEIQRLVVQESEDKHNKSITLKASKQQHVSSESEEENISECPNNEVKEKGDFKREKKGKAKKAYITWDDNDVSSSSSSDDEEANLCLLASVTSSVDSTSTSKGTTYDQLLNAFYETHDEANRLALSLNRLKGLNNWLENKVKDLEEELYKGNEDLEHLDLIYKNSSCSCEKICCENCELLEKKICYLLKTLVKLTTGKSNFEDVLVSQKCIFGKADLIRFYVECNQL